MTSRFVPRRLRRSTVSASVHLLLGGGYAFILKSVPSQELGPGYCFYIYYNCALAGPDGAACCTEYRKTTDQINEVLAVR